MDKEERNEMELEVIAFYTTDRCDEKELLKGTLHIRLPALGIDIRGIAVSRRKSYWHFGLPLKSSVDDSGGLVRYPIVCFSDRTQNDELMKEIRVKGRKFIEQKLFSLEPSCQEK